MSAAVAAISPAELERVADSNWPKQLHELTAVVARAVHTADNGISYARVRTIAAHVTLALTERYGGSSLYYPKTDAITRACRDLRIFVEWDHSTDGSNGIRALARRYRISDVAVWATIRRQRHLQAAAIGQVNPEGE